MMRCQHVGARRRTACPSRYRLAAFVLVMLVMPGMAWCRDSVDESRQSRTKAAFLYRFPEFVTWAADSSAPGHPRFVIAVIGNCPIIPPLRQIIEGQSVEGRPFEMRQVQRSDIPANADLVFICDGERERITQIIQAAPARALVVTESPGALQQGSVINFVPSNEGVRFEVSLDAAQRRGLMLSSRLLDVAIGNDTEHRIILNRRSRSRATDVDITIHIDHVLGASSAGGGWACGG